MKQLSHNQHTNSTKQNCKTVLEFVTMYVKEVQTRLGNYLQQKTERVNRKKKKLLLLLFIVLFGSSSIAVILHAFVTLDAPVPTSKIPFSKYPVIHIPTPNKKDSLITYKVYERISRFQLFLKHLQQDSSGRKIYDSLVQARPYLLDSIRQIDSIYFNQ